MGVIGVPRTRHGRRCAPRTTYPNHLGDSTMHDDLHDPLLAALAFARRKHEAMRDLRDYARYIADRTRIIDEARAVGTTWREIGEIIGEHPANVLNKQRRAHEKAEATK